MPARTNSSLAKSPIVITFLVFAVIAFLALAKEVLRPLALALLIAFALAPLVRWIERRGLPRVVAVGMAMVSTLGILASGLYLLGYQLVTLVGQLPTYEQNILAKARWLRSSEPRSLERGAQALERLATTLRGGRPQAPAMNVRVIEGGWLSQDIGTAAAPYLEILGSGLIVLVLVLFMLTNPSNLMERIIRLVGQSRISMTMQTLDELGTRISRYLATFVCVNALTGLAVGLGLWAAGVEFAALWGILSATLRFVPYLGPIFAFILPVVFTFASAPGWGLPLAAAAIILTVEIVNDVVIEPIVYGKSAGVSPLALLVAAAFWTWIWGPLGLLLSTALTVSLTVLGKYVRELQFLDILLGDDVKLSDDVKFYQQLLMMDEDGVWEVLQPVFQRRSRVEAFDGYLIPALARTRRDTSRGSLEERDEAFIHRMVGDLIDDTSTDIRPPGEPVARIVGVAINGAAENLALRMLADLLAPQRIDLVILDGAASPLQITERIAAEDPDLVVISRLASGGGVHVRYLLRKLRSRYPGLPLLAGLWGLSSSDTQAATAAREAGATVVATTLAAAIDWIRKNAPEPENQPVIAGNGPRDGKKPEVLR
jgi:predicted PurR-regulated permease PerM